MIEITSNTALASVQDLGRHGYLRYGVGTSGAMDDLALATGNLLLGNEMGAAAVEIPMFPYQVCFLEDCAFALTGADVSASLSGRAVPPWWVLKAKKGDTLELNAPMRGARCYLCLAGGIDVPLSLGSRSTQLRGAFGGLEGRTLKHGDVLRGMLAESSATMASRIPDEGFGVIPPEFEVLIDGHPPSADGKLTSVRVIPAAEYECYEPSSLEAFWRQSWKVTSQSDRYGYRLAGEALVPKRTLEQRSHGIVPGVIQVPHSGQPIIQLRDAQPSGGYPKIGTIIEADLWRLGQARPGSLLQFIQIDYAGALVALEANQAYLARVKYLAELYLLSKS